MVLGLSMLSLFCKCCFANDKKNEMFFETTSKTYFTGQKAEPNRIKNYQTIASATDPTCLNTATREIQTQK